MRLWHESLLTRLPRQQLLGQHRELAALRGNGWGEKNTQQLTIFFNILPISYISFTYWCWMR